MQTHGNNIKVNILLQQREDGKTVASVLEVSDCTVEGNSREQAISSLRENLIRKIGKAEVISLELPMNQIGDLDLDRVNKCNPPWSKSLGIFTTDVQFEEFQQEIQSCRDELDTLST